MHNVSAYRKLEHSLRYELELSALLARLGALCIHLPGARLEQVIVQSLADLSRFVGADRGYIFRHHWAEGYSQNTHGWCAPGVSEEKDKLQHMPLDMIPDWLALHREGKPVHIVQLSDCKSTRTREMLERQGIRSMLAVPMMHEGDCLGLVGFDSVHQERRYSDRELSLLQVFAQIQVNIHLHAETRLALENEREQLATILEGTNAGTWIWWPRTGALVLNERWVSMLGYELAELEPISIRTWEFFAHPEDLPDARKLLERHLHGQSAGFDGELRMRHRAGHWVWAHARGRVVKKFAGGQELVVSGTLQDISQRKRAELDLRNSEHRFRQLLEDVPGIAVQACDSAMHVNFWNRGSELLYGYDAADALGRSLLELIVPDAEQASVRKQALHWLAGEGVTSSCELQMIDRQGQTVPVQSNQVMQINADGERELFRFDIDLRELKSSEARLKLAASVFTHSHEGILITDQNSRIVDVNDAFVRITGYSREQVLGRSPNMLQSGRQKPQDYREMWQALQANDHWTGEFWNRRQDGELYAEYLTVSAVRDAAGVVRNYIGLFSDITEQKTARQQLEHSAHFDALTGLPNRLLLADRLRRAMAEARRHQHRVAVAYIDLDGFKSINDTHGHEVGDQFLKAVGQSMCQALREVDTVARLGGDEFVVVLELAQGDAIESLLDRLRTALSGTLTVGDLQLPVAASIGVSLYPQREALDGDQLLRQADQAMYAAKHAGKSRTRFFQGTADETCSPS